MHTRAKRLVRIYFLIAGVPLLAGLLGFAVYDPLQVYHTPWGRPLTFHSNFRLQAAGVFRHQDFDAVLLGTSMMENTSADEASRLFGDHFVNVALTASDFVERSLVLDDLLRRRPVRRIVFSLDSVYTNTRTGYPLYPMPTFDFLYDRNPFNDIRVYLNRHFAECLLTWSDAEDCIGRRVTLDRPNAWFRQAEHAVRFGGIDNWCRARDHYQIQDAYAVIGKAAGALASGNIMVPAQAELRQKTDLAMRYVDDNVIRHVRAHPKTRFHLFFPPYSRLTFAIWHQTMPMHSHIHQAVVRHLAHLADRLPNLEVYGFEDADFLDDLANYKDLGHYGAGIDSRLLRDMAAGRHRIDGGNVEAYLRQAVARARRYDLAALKKRLDACMAGR